MSKSYTKEQIEKLKSELKTITEERNYLRQCCINAGKELEKHSFKWDGKEKNLEVQALYLNEMYEKLESALEEVERIILYKNQCANQGNCFYKTLQIINSMKGV